jgi:hypothetical protein
MDIHGYPDIQQVQIWSGIHAHGYFHGRGAVRLMDLDLDQVLQYLSKPAPLPSGRISPLVVVKTKQRVTFLSSVAIPFAFQIW